MKSVAVFEEFWIPVHVNHIEELHDTFPADPKDSCQRKKSIKFYMQQKSKQAAAYESKNKDIFLAWV